MRQRIVVVVMLLALCVAVLAGEAQAPVYQVNKLEFLLTMEPARESTSTFTCFLAGVITNVGSKPWSRVTVEGSVFTRKDMVKFRDVTAKGKNIAPGESWRFICLPQFYWQWGDARWRTVYDKYWGRVDKVRVVYD